GLQSTICLDTSRFRDRRLPLSRTLLPVSSQWFDWTGPSTRKPSPGGNMKYRTFRRTFALFAEKQLSEAPKVALLLLALALPAVAQKPTITFTPFTSAFVPAADACGFDVLVTPQAGRPNKERMMQFSNTAIIAG